METNINKLSTLYGMQLHIAEEVDVLLNQNLPWNYAKKAIKRASELKIETTISVVRNVRTLKYANIQILNILIELANENKAIAEAGLQKLSAQLAK